MSIIGHEDNVERAFLGLETVSFYFMGLTSFAGKIIITENKMTSPSIQAYSLKRFYCSELIHIMYFFNKSFHEADFLEIMESWKDENSFWK